MLRRTPPLAIVAVILQFLWLSDTAFTQNPPPSGPSKPNIVFILTDDQGYGDLSAHGHPFLKTPHIDQLRAQSVRFENFYVSPSCSPTRAALLTGMHEFRNGVTHTIHPLEHLYAEATTLPQLLSKAGYKTGFVGKWHLGNDPKYSPDDRGFEYTSFSIGHAGEFFDPVMVRNRKRSQEKGFREDIYFNDAMDFIKSCGSQPFFAYLATVSPHEPCGAPEEFVAPFRDKVTENEAKYFGMIQNIDHNLGRLMKFLEDTGLAENTIVIMMNDNGETVGLNVYNANMRGSKCTIWHGGTRAFSFWRWPNKWKPHDVQKLAAHIDVLPTLCELAGAEIPEPLKKQLDGLSLTPLLASESPERWNDNRMLFQHVGRWPAGLEAEHKYAMAGVRQGNYLMVRSRPCDSPECNPSNPGQCLNLRGIEMGAKHAPYTENNGQFHWAVTPRDKWMLYETKADPGCYKELSEAESARLKAMSEAYEKWWAEVLPLIQERSAAKIPKPTKNPNRL